MNDSFYITLPSNVKSEFFENTVANFKTKLAKRIELDSEWEVGLSTISYTYSLYNLVNNGTVTLRYFESDPRKVVAEDNIKGPIYAGRYDKVELLIESIQQRFERLMKKIKSSDNPKINFDESALPTITYDERTKYVTIKLGIYNNRYVFPEFSKSICFILGINKESLDSLAGTKLIEYSAELNNIPVEQRSTWNPSQRPKDFRINGDKPIHLQNIYHSLYVYCDIIKPSLVGDSFTQLLRFVEIPPNYNYGEQIVCTYPDTYYHKILFRDFDSIEIDIKDDTGKPMQFEFGRSIIVLHFRRIKN